MSKAFRLTPIAAVIALAAACASTQQMLADQQGTAVETALERGRFDLACPAAASARRSS